MYRSSSVYIYFENTELFLLDFSYNHIIKSDNIAKFLSFISENKQNYLLCLSYMIKDLSRQVLVPELSKVSISCVNSFGILRSDS